MGKRLQECFDEADRLGGLVARMRLASLAQITSTEAATSDDTASMLARAQKALDTIRVQYGATRDGAGAREVAAAPNGDEQTRTLRRHLMTYLDLMAQRSLFLGDVDNTVRRVNLAASMALTVHRVSVWFTDKAGTKISCADLYDHQNGKHTSGTELFAKDFPAYFRALKTERTIAAHDAHTDPRTSCFSEPYLKPLGITSMLDVPIWVNRAMVGVICHEHRGPARTWNRDEETFAYLMSNFVALALERRGQSPE
ncbi:MAG TPA: GAF domain-containing protein [Polyangiaceae bacterium]